MGKFSKFSLPLKSLPVGTHSFEFNPDKAFFENMESADIHDANLNCEVQVKYDGDVYDLHFHITGDVTVLCDRCLEEMSWPVDAVYHVEVKYGDDFTDDSDELIEIPSSVNDLNVAYMIYDTVSLAVPIKHVHPAGKCNRQMSALLHKHRVSDMNDEDAELEDELMDGIDNDAPSDGQATDPRWAALRDLASENPDDSRDDD